MYKMVKIMEKPILKTHLKPLCLIILTIVMINLIGISLVSAFQFDNVKSYNPNTKTATITNAFGLGSTIAEVSLDSPREVLVFPGENIKVAEFTINNYDDYNDAFGKMEFYDLSTKQEISKDFVYKYKTIEYVSVDDYRLGCKERTLGNGTIQEYDCVNTKTGSHFENQVVWNNFNEKAKLPKGIRTIGIFTDVSEGERIEWIPNLFGGRISEWAVFIGAKRFEYNLDIQSALGAVRQTNWRSVLFQVGKIGPNEDFIFKGISIPAYRLGYPDTFSVMLAGTNGSGAPDYTNILSVNKSINVSHFMSDVAVLVWYNITMPDYNIIAGTNYTLIFNQSGTAAIDVRMGINDSNSDYSVSTGLRSYGSVDNGVTWSVTPSQVGFMVWGSSENVTSKLISPIDTSTTIETAINFTANSTAVTGFNLKNITFKVWRDDLTLFNSTVRTIDETKNQTVLQINDFVLDSYIWNVVVCGNDSVTVACGSAPSNFTFSLGINITDLDYNNDTIEGSTETFKVNITTVSGVTLTQSNLIYNSTNFGGAWTSLGGDKYGIIKTITAPLVSADINKSFFFNFIFSDGTSHNTSVNNQTVRALSIDDCSVNTIVVLNYTLKDEENQTTLDGTLFNTTIDVDIEIFAKGFSINSILNFSGNFNQDNPAGVCLSDNLSTAEYAMFTTTKYVSNSRETEYHYLQNFSLKASSIPQNISLFDLLSADSESFSVTFKDNFLLPVPDALINVQRQYVAEGVFKSVEIGKTDVNGRTILHLVRNDVVYTIVVTKNGQVLSTFNNVIAFCDDFTIGDCKITLNQATSPTTLVDLTTYQNLVYNLNFNETARDLTFIFSTLDGSVHTLTLNATKFDMWGNDTVCSDKISTSSGTLVCHIPAAYGNVSFKFVVYSYSDRGIIVQGTGRIIPDRSDIFGGEGVIFLLIMMITIPLMMITSTIGVVIGAIIGLVAAFLLMIYSGGAIISTGSAIMWLIIAGVILIYKIAERSKT